MLRGYEGTGRLGLTNRTLVGQLVPFVADQPVVRYDVIQTVPAESREFRSSTPVSAADSVQCLLSDWQQGRWSRGKNGLTVETYPLGSIVLPN